MAADEKDSASKNKKKPVVFLVCTGLGNINRGYESFTQECFTTLKSNTFFDLYLIKGGGRKNKNEIVVSNCRRHGTAARIIAKLFNRNAYNIEQISFCLCFIPLIITKKPSLIYYSDFALGSYLWHIKKRLKFSYKLLFVNGAPNGPPYKTEDHVQQLLPVYYSIGVKSNGGNAAKHTLLPYAFNINVEQRMRCLHNKTQIRKDLGFSPDKKIVLTVGAINTYHKRIDYIINEVAMLGESFFLIILGQFDAETPELINLANNKLPGRCIIKNVAHSEVEKYYTAADYFVLASLQEGFPRVTIEALSYGLPCIVHDYVITRQVLHENGIYIDMRFEGALSQCLNDDKFSFNKPALMDAAYKMYSWDVLKERYIDMISKQIFTN